MKRSLEMLLFLAFGVSFGFVLSRSGAADYDFVQKMFLFEDIQLYGIIGAAVAVTAPGLLLLKRVGKTISGEPIRLTAKPFHRGNIVGGMLFGIGWSMTGMCPGPILVNVGEGKLYAIAALAGTLLGAYGLGAAYPRLIKPMKLPDIQLGTGDG
jgi:uncharacterized membrane protein YedE/YeeE